MSSKFYTHAVALILYTHTGTHTHAHTLKKKIMKELGRVACTCNQNAWEMESGRPGMQGQPQLLNEFKGSQSYTRSFIKNILL